MHGYLSNAQNLKLSLRNIFCNMYKIKNNIKNILTFKT
ncbi:Uncharacterized protein dnl_03270 [Desulfonema limicola]|uniref:Uncharacterized protein n=1 Tax=Desulfonema limicola TaxID=45656 RepID=A0A975B3I2_9BACT|nr:Uncharacterized protein dnl_03270 [Desulfonema limicola]